MKRIVKIFFILFVSIAYAPCGGVGGSAFNSDNLLAVRVKDEKRFNPNVEHGLTNEYVVTVRGEGMDGEIKAYFPPDATEGVVEGIPKGQNREVIVEAVNPNSTTIRMGERGGVNIGGGVADVEVELESVPIFANLADGNVIENTRFGVKIFSDPEHPIMVEGAIGGGLFSLVDASSNLSEIYAEEATWLGSISPMVMPSGEYTLIVRDLQNGRSTTIDVRIVDGEASHPATFVAGHATSSRASSYMLAIDQELGIGGY